MTNLKSVLGIKSSECLKEKITALLETNYRKDKPGNFIC